MPPDEDKQVETDNTTADEKTASKEVDSPPDVTQIATQIANRAVSSQLTRSFAARDKALDKTLNERLDPLNAKIDALLAASAAKEEKPPKSGDVNPELMKLREQVDNMTAERVESAAREKVRAAQEILREQKRALGVALEASGIRGVKNNAVVALLHERPGLLSRTEDGQTVMVFERSGYTEELPLDKGVAEWVTTPEGKEFLPPVGAGGSGSKDSAASNLVLPKGKAARREFAVQKLADLHI